MIGQRVSLHLRFLLSELYGPLSWLFKKEPPKGLAVLGGMLDVVVNPEKNGFFLLPLLAA